MSNVLPTSGFKWLDPAKFNLHKNNDNSSRGCVLEVDLEYPKVLHKLHNAYHLASDNLKNKKEMMSNYQLKIAVDYIFMDNTIKKYFLTSSAKKSNCLLIKTRNFV